MPQRIPDGYLSEHPCFLFPVDEVRARIEARIEMAPCITLENVRDQSDCHKFELEYDRWMTYNEELLKRSFSTTELAEQYSSGVWGGFIRVKPSAQQQAYDLKQIVEIKVSCLRSILDRLELIPLGQSQSGQQSAVGTCSSRSKVFIVHGHDEAARESLARFIERLGVEAVILHEQASSGRTIIEKLENFSDVSFVVILLTPDDVGAVVSQRSNLLQRAKQNVVLELGYFIGKLGRKNVCALYRSDVELPSDILGVVYIKLDEDGAWKFRLAKELMASDFSVDMNKAL
jgi:predicted nucleotide-binding protein